MRGHNIRVKPNRHGIYRLAEARFTEKTVERDGCVVWTGKRNPSGYGSFKMPSGNVLAHRWAYEHAHGPIPPGLLVCHTCDNPPCVKIEHLWLGTGADNVHDAQAKGRRRPPKPARERRAFARLVDPTKWLSEGENHWKAKLAAAQVIEMRQIWLAGGVTISALSREFGVSRFHVKAVVEGRSRKSG